MVLACTGVSYARPHSGLAPADEYFGRMKMSILGIRNSIRDANISFSGDPTSVARTLTACHWAEDAIEDWGNKYPDDSWLPGMMLSLGHLYARIHGAEAHLQETRMLVWVHAHYRGSKFERAIRIAAR